MSSLAGLRVLVTRPAGQAQALATQIAQHGGQAMCVPMLRIEPLDGMQDPLRAQLGHRPPTAIIFISTNAVRIGLPVLRAVLGGSLANATCYAIGSATAAALEAAGVAAVATKEAMTSESLLALAALQAVRDQRLLIVKGEGGRQTLRQRLTERGAEVVECPVYRRLGPLEDRDSLARKLNAEHINVALLGSAEALVNLCGLLEPDRTGSMWMVVPGERVAEIARGNGCRRLLIAANATDQAMLDRLQASRELIVAQTDNTI